MEIRTVLRSSGVLWLYVLVIAALIAPAVHASDDLAARIAAANRSAEDKSQDASRKAPETLGFLGVQEGMVVLDLIAAGGWYSEVLAAAVGPDGRVYAQNPPFVLQMREGANDKSLTARLAGDRLPNVTRLDREIVDLGLEPGSLDAVFTSMNWHDIYNNGAEAAAGTLQTLKGLLKPGGFIGIVDHNGKAGVDNKALHRMEKHLAIEQAQAAGFTVTESDLLANPADDHSKGVFDPSLRGNTDRFLIKLTKP